MSRQVSKGELAEIFSVGTQTVALWQKDGMPVVLHRRGQPGNLYDTGDCIRWYAKRGRGNPRGSTASASVEPDSLDYATERARLTHFQANAAQIDTEAKKGNLWPLETVSLMLQRIIGAARGRLLAIDGKLRNRVPDMPPRAYELVEELIREALDELSADVLPGDVATSLGRYHSSLEAAAEVDPDAVGAETRRDH
jgi:phage terminase Nu1 subunit (DNA packaging protein)